MGGAITQGRRSGAHRGAFEDLTARDPVESASLHFWGKHQQRIARHLEPSVLKPAFVGIQTN